MEDEDLDELIETLESELSDPETPSHRLDMLFAEHAECGSNPCEICAELDGNVRDSVVCHPNCSDELTDLALESALREDKLVFVDALLSAVTRSSLPQRWVDWAVDYEWRYAVQFQPEVLDHFIRNISKGRELTEEQKSRIQKANDLDVFPS